MLRGSGQSGERDEQAGGTSYRHTAPEGARGCSHVAQSPESATNVLRHKPEA